MLEIFFPDEHVTSIYHIDLLKLKQKNIVGLIFDIDNTLVPYFVDQADSRLIDYFTQLQRQGFKICLLSNSSAQRVKKFQHALKVPVVASARKPFIGKLRQAMALIATASTNTAIIGDQVFTDVWAGNRAGITTILVNPISRREQWRTWIKRGLEAKLLQIYRRHKNAGLVVVNDRRKR